jgi:hypothetical protein
LQESVVRLNRAALAAAQYRQTDGNQRKEAALLNTPDTAIEEEYDKDASDDRTNENDGQEDVPVYLDIF